MDAKEQEKVVYLIKDKFPDEVLLVEWLYDFLTIHLKNERIVEIIAYLYTHPEAKFEFLTNLFAVHYPSTTQIGLVYQLHNMESNQRVRLKIFLDADRPKVPTLTTVFAGANWMEREAYDFFGVVFEDHPNLKRILNVDEMIIFPMRKEYPLEDQTREDKNDALFGR